MSTGKRYFDLLVCVPLEVELDELYRVFPPKEELTSNYIQRYTVETGKDNISILVVAQDEMGRSSARRCVAAALADFDVGLIVCLGIAGGLSDDLSLGGVCYSGTVVDVYDNAKVVDIKTGMDTAFAPTHMHTDRAITSALNFLRSNPSLSDKYRNWQAICADNATEALLRSNADSLLASFELEPKSLNGTIACGQVSDSKRYNDKLKKLDRKILAIETESGGVFAAAEEAEHRKYLTIRGISDYAEGKSKLEASSKGVVRKVAAYNAAAFLRAQLDNPYFTAILEKLRQAELAGIGSQALAPAVKDLASVVAEIENNIDAKLRELSPEYRFTEKGYSLPIPRIKPTDFESTYHATSDGPSEIEDVIAKIDAIVIDIPRTYPDDSLAWVIAHSLIISDIDRRQIIPIVVDGKYISPPSNSLKSQWPEIVEFAVQNSDTAVPVFIIDNPPLNSKTKSDFIVSECKKYLDFKFIFVTRGELDVIAATTLADALSVESFTLCAISFEGIAHFVQKYCQLPSQEADVIALRLTETFERFGLLAHPTYFAGIPKEVLVALLQANKRSELIQLAVDGFLTLLVAGDAADIALSRTTRENFLRTLVIETKIKGRNFSIAECIEFISDFASLYDFDIEPVDFLQEFVQNGILHYFQNGVHFSLPFIESYLLASEMTLRPDMARAYFDIDSEDFDFAAFDLYSEMGPDSQITEKVIGRLNALSVDWAIAEKNLVLLSEASPKLLGKPDALARVQKRLEVAMKNVRENKDHTERKQRLIDLSNEIRESVSQQRVEKSNKGTSSSSINEEEFASLTRYWVIAVILLGSGAERIFATGKVAMAESIASVGAIIVDKWTRRNQTINFDEIRDNLFDEVISSKMEFSNEEERDEIRQLFINVTDVLEHNFMSEPMRRVLGFLGEQARQKVLATTLERAETSDLVSGVLKSAWLTDIDVKRGAGRLSDELKKLSAAPLLRMGLATHLMAQVFWRHADKTTQLALLEAANDTIKPLELSFDKGQIKRDIEQGRLTAPDRPVTASSRPKDFGPPDRT